MKRILLFLAFLFLALACTPKTLEQELSTFLATRSDEPLKGTIWEHQSGEQYNRYLWFSEADVSLFYGLVEDGELQRWSPFYTSPYLFSGNWVEVALAYPLWGHTEYTKTADIIKGEGFTIDLSGDTYEYYGPYTESIEGQWMFIFAGVAP